MPEADAERELREALDNLWGCIAFKEIQDLEPETRELAIRNHDLLHHSDESFHCDICGSNTHDTMVHDSNPVPAHRLVDPNECRCKANGGDEHPHRYGAGCVTEDDGPRCSDCGTELYRCGRHPTPTWHCQNDHTFTRLPA